MKYLKIAVIIGIIIMTGACKSSKKTTGYNGVQTKPTTAAQKESANRGLKIEKEECEEMAMQGGSAIRDAGNAISDREAFATNLALLDARSKLARQLEALVTGAIRNFNQQHEADKDLSSVAKATGLQQEYWEQFLTNTRQICKNTYVKEDGRYNVYVCVEMDQNQQRAMYKKLSEEKKLHIDFQEHLFLQELDKMKKEYQQKQNE